MTMNIIIYSDLGPTGQHNDHNIFTALQTNYVEINNSVTTFSISYTDLRQTHKEINRSEDEGIVCFLPWQLGDWPW